MALKRMDNVGIVVDDLAATIDFFRELGLELEGRTTIEGEWAGRVTGLGDQRVDAKIAPITPHALRHTFGTPWLQAGGDIYKMSKILGYSSVAVTEARTTRIC